MDTPQFNVQAALEQRHWWFLGKRHILRELVREVTPPSKHTRIVDIGCGTGGNIATFADAYACVGTDPHPDAIRLARQRFPHVQFICGTVPEVLGQIPQPVHLYLLTDVLEHVEDDRALFSRILATVPPGAYVLITVPADMRLWTQHDVSHGHYRRYDIPSFERLLADLPLTVLLLSHYNSRLYPVVRCVRTMNRWLGRTNGAAGTDFQTPPQPVNRLLRDIFASESRVLRGLLSGRRARGFSYGVSLIALLRREQGTAPAMDPRPVEGRLAERVHRARALVFDFDGTLVDSNAIKWRAFDRCFAQFPEHRAQIQAYCHAEHHVPRWEKFRHVYEKIVGRAYTPDIGAALSAQFERDTTADIIAARELPGAESFVAAAAASGRFMGLLSNTPHAILMHILERRGWRAWFTQVQGAPVRKASWLARLKAGHQLTESELVFFGDTPEDARAAEDAGCVFIGIGKHLEGKVAHWVEDFTRLSRTFQQREACA